MAILAFWREMIIAVLLAYALWQRGEAIDARGNLERMTAAYVGMSQAAGACSNATKDLAAKGSAARAAGRKALADADALTAAHQAEVAELRLKLAGSTPAGAGCPAALSLIRKSLGKP